MESMEKTRRNDLFFDGADMTLDALSSALRLQIALLTQLSWLPHKKEGEACRKLVGKQHINWHRLLPHPLSGRAIYFLSSNCSDMILFVALVARKAANDSRIIKFYRNVSLEGNLWSNDIYTNIHYVLKVTAVMNILEWAFDLDDAFATKCSSLFVYFRPHLFWLWSWQEYGRFPKVLRWARARKCLLFTKLGAWCRGHTTRLRQESHRTTSVCPTVHTLREKISQWQSREQLLLMDLLYKPRQLTVPSRGQWENSLNSQVVRTFCGAWQSKNVTCYPICSYRGFVSHYFSAPGFSKYKQNRYLFSVYISVCICTRRIKRCCCCWKSRHYYDVTTKRIQTFLALSRVLSFLQVNSEVLEQTLHTEIQLWLSDNNLSLPVYFPIFFRRSTCVLLWWRTEGSD